MSDGSYLRQLPENTEVRNNLNAAEVRADEDGVTMVVGHAATFNQPYEIGGAFREQIAPGAFDSVLDNDVLALVNHNVDRTLARSTSDKRPLRLSADEVGLRSEFPIPDHAVDVRSDLEDGVLRHMSFAFTVSKESWDEGEGTELDLRTIEEFGRLWDVSIVANPANPNTDVALRSKAQWAEARELLDARESRKSDTVTEGSGEGSQETVEVEEHTEEVEEILDNLTPRQRQLAANDAWLAGTD